MVKRYYAYIDEAGDEGLGKLRSEEPTGQSRWLILGGIVVGEEANAQLPSWRDSITDLFESKKKSRDLHFRFLKHAQKVAACKDLEGRKFGIITICSNKVTLLDSKRHYDLFRQKGHFYNYLTRFALERLTTAVATAASVTGEDAELHVNFSRRGGTDYHAMREYLEFMRDGKEKVKPVRSIDWSVFDPANIKVENHSRLAGLQLADVVTSAVAAGLEPNVYGHVEPRYAQILSRHFVRHRKTALNCGMTLIPPYGRGPMSDDQKSFIDGLVGRPPAPDARR